jgi:hypothetical protein
MLVLVTAAKIPVNLCRENCIRSRQQEIGNLERSQNLLKDRGIPRNPESK